MVRIMNFEITSIFYLVIGISAAVALLVRDRQKSIIGLALWFVIEALFWPVFVPLLLSGTPTERTDLTTFLKQASDKRFDGMARMIEQVEDELDAALSSLSGWSDAVLVEEHDRIEELRAAWRAQAERIRELNQLLGQSSFVSSPEPTAPKPETQAAEASAISFDEKFAHSQESRQNNITRLRQVRDQLHQDLLGTIAWVRELVTMIHLAKYTGAPASRAQELVSQIAKAVEGLAKVSA